MKRSAGRSAGSQRGPRFTGRGRARSWWLLGTAVLVAVLWAAVQLLKLSVPLAIQVLVAVIAATTVLVIPELRERRKQDDERHRTLETHLYYWSRTEGLSLVREVKDPIELGARPVRDNYADAAPTYVARTQDKELDEALRNEHFVLIIGDSMAGKTRSAFEAMNRIFPDRVLIVPTSPNSLNVLLNLGFRFYDAVIWLDDLHRYLESLEFTEHMLHQLTSRQSQEAGTVTILATITTSAFDKFAPSEGIKSPAWQLLQRAKQVRLSLTFDDEECARAKMVYDSDKEVVAALEHYGVPEYLAAGPELVNRFENNLRQRPVATAIVRSAIDWRRAGLSRPIPSDLAPEFRS